MVAMSRAVLGRAIAGHVPVPGCAHLLDQDAPEAIHDVDTHAAVAVQPERRVFAALVRPREEPVGIERLGLREHFGVPMALLNADPHQPAGRDVKSLELDRSCGPPIQELALLEAQGLEDDARIRPTTPCGRRRVCRSDTPSAGGYTSPS
jgi:hypothetical protein